jgi:hypothetical protein
MDSLRGEAVADAERIQAASASHGLLLLIAARLKDLADGLHDRC